MRAEGEQNLVLDIIGLIIQPVVWLLCVEKFPDKASEAWLENLRVFYWVYQLIEGFYGGKILWEPHICMFLARCLIRIQETYGLHRAPIQLGDRKNSSLGIFQMQ